MEREIFEQSGRALIELGGGHFGMLPLDPVEWRDLGIKVECSKLPPLTAEELGGLRDARSVWEGTDVLMGSRSPPWLMGCRDVTLANNERAVIAGAIPRSGVGNNLPILRCDPDT